MRVYEELFIVKPDAPEEEVESFIEQVKQVISTGHGNVDKVDNWGIRKLAYKISKYNEGRYVLVVFTSTPDLVREVERRGRKRVADLVIKFITVRIDEKQKKIDKRKKAREKRAARRPAPQVAAPAAPFPAAPTGGDHGLPGQPGAPAPAHPALSQAGACGQGSQPPEPATEGKE